MKALDKITEPDLLVLTMEESAELQQACSKLYRIITGRNVTTVTLDQAMNSICEEIADLDWCIEGIIEKFSISSEEIKRRKQAKALRAESRLSLTEGAKHA